MTKTVLSFLSVLFVAVGAVEDEGVLIQKAAAATSWAEGTETEEEQNEIVFTMSEKDFANASLMIPEKLKAAGIEEHTFDSEGLIVYTAKGSLLQNIPHKADFPLRLTYDRRGRPPPDRTNWTSTEMEIDMAKLAGGTYNFSRPNPDCWKRELEGKISTWFDWLDMDHFTLSTCQCGYCRMPNDPFGEVCAVAMSGSNDGNDWLNNLNMVSRGTFCGRADYHSGFASEASDIVNSKEFEPFTKKLKNCSKIIFTGHSLGGAIASILSRCVNCRRKCGKKPKSLDFEVESELYTIGAPGVTTKSPLKNDLAKDGTFKGMRSWTYTRRCFGIFGCQDPVPWVMGQIVREPYLHPKVAAVGFGKAGGIRAWDATNHEAVYEPFISMIPDWKEHAVSRYVKRMQLHKVDAIV